MATMSGKFIAPADGSTQSGWKVLLLLLALGVLALTGVFGGEILNMKTNTGSERHAVQVHGPEAEQAFNCLSQHGFYAIYKERRHKKMFSWHFLCQDDAGKVFDIIFMDNAAKSGSAFSPADGTVQGVKQWLTNPTKMASHVTWEKVPTGIKAIIESLIQSKFKP